VAACDGATRAGSGKAHGSRVSDLRESSVHVGPAGAFRFGESLARIAKGSTGHLLGKARHMARGLLGILIVIAIVFFLLKVAVVGGIVGVIALVLLVLLLLGRL
jgi:hypothetical protein